MLVRFANSQGKEVGRLPLEAANFISTLIDLDICVFDGTCIYAKKRIRTGDNILLQLRCYMKASGFKPLESLNQDTKPQPFNIGETAEEKTLKLRRLALLQLFEKTGMAPCRNHELSRGNQRDKLLKTAQSSVDEIEVSKPSNDSSDADEEDDKTTLKDNQLDSLYKKAQMFDINMAQREPANTFAFELRPYQKQVYPLLDSVRAKLQCADLDIRHCVG